MPNERPAHLDYQSLPQPPAARLKLTWDIILLLALGIGMPVAFLVLVLCLMIWGGF